MAEQNPESWTVQADYPYEPEAGRPGQVLRQDQLPDPEVQKDAGIDPEGWRRAGALFVEGEPSAGGLSADRSLDDIEVADEVRANAASRRGRRSAAKPDDTD